MSNEKMNAIRAKFETSIQDAIKETGYVKGGETAPLLNKTLLNFLGTSSLENLWGPGSSLFVVRVARRMKTVGGIEVSYNSIKTVISGMDGYDDGIPADLEKWIETQIDEGGDEEVEDSLFLATLICYELGIPTPIEVEYIMAVLGEDASPAGAEILWIENPEKYKLDITSGEDVIAMAKATASLNRKNKNLEFSGQKAAIYEIMTKIYYATLQKVAERCASYLETKGQVETESESDGEGGENATTEPETQGEATPDPETQGEATTEPSRSSEEPAANIETLVVNVGHPGGMTAGGSRHSGYYGGGGGSTDWTVGEVVLGVAAVGAIGAALWYGYNRLTAEEYDVNLSEFSIPDLDFDFEIPEIDFDFDF